jgi:hypothetical protein
MDEWNSQDRFLDQGNERDKWRRYFSWPSFGSNPHLDRFAGRLPCFIPMHIGYTACTIREQFGNRYASTVWWFWHRLDVIDGFFPLFPYLLIYRTEVVAGSNPTRSTWITPYGILAPYRLISTSVSLSLLMIYSIVKIFFGMSHLPFPECIPFPGQSLTYELDQVSGDRSVSLWHFTHLFTRILQTSTATLRSSFMQESIQFRHVSRFPQCWFLFQHLIPA